MKAIKIPEKTVSRLSIYLKCVEELENEGVALEEVLGLK